MEQFIEPIMTILASALVAFLVAKWELVKAKAAASENKFDDAAVAVIEKIARAVANDNNPTTKGGGQTKPPGSD